METWRPVSGVSWRPQNKHSCKMKCIHQVSQRVKSLVDIQMHQWFIFRVQSPPPCLFHYFFFPFFSAHDAGNGNRIWSWFSVIADPMSQQRQLYQLYITRSNYITVLVCSYQFYIPFCIAKSRHSQWQSCRLRNNNLFFFFHGFWILGLSAASL